MAYKLKGGWQIWTPCLAARSPDTQCHSFIEGRRGRPFGLFLNLLKDGIYWLWKYLHRMFICSRHSSPSSLAPCSSLCPEPSGHLMAWVVCSPHFQGSSVAVDYALKKKKKRTTTPRVFGVSSWPRVAVFGALEGAFLRQGVPLSPLRPQSSIDGWGHLIPAP